MTLKNLRNKPPNCKVKECKPIKELVQFKRKRYNKNKKKAWRKKIDLTDIEDAEEERRREERHGGPLEERESSDLFSLDFGVDDVEQNKVERSKLRSKEKYEKFNQLKDGKDKEEPLLKCHRFINGLPGAEAIFVKTGTNKQKTPKLLEHAKKLRENKLMAIIHKKQQNKQKLVLLQLKKRNQISFKKDLWNDDKNDLDCFGTIGKSFLEEPVKHYLNETKKWKVKPPRSLHEKISLLPQVDVPDAGASYNPSYEAHQNLLRKALKYENQRQKKEQKELRLIKKYLPSSKDGITESEKLAEMLEGLPLKDAQKYQNGEEDEEEEEEEGKKNPWSGQSKKEKKSARSRKKAKTLKIREEIRLKTKARKRMESNIYRLKSYKKEILQEEEKLKAEKLEKKKKRREKKYKPHKISQYKFEESDVLVPLGDELSSSLRTVQPKGNAMDDMFKHFQRRNIVETRIRVQRTKAKTKLYVKRNIKEDLKTLWKRLIK